MKEKAKYEKGCQLAKQVVEIAMKMWQKLSES